MSKNFHLSNLNITYKALDVGQLVWDPNLKTALFSYSDSFLDSDIPLSPFLMPISRDIYSFPTLSKKTFKGLPPMFSDSLPDKFGNKLMEEWMKSKGLQLTDFNVLFRLSYVGNRGAGALEYLPISERFELPDKVDFDEVLKIIRRINIQKEQVHIPLHTEDSTALKMLYGFGGSVGGARDKMYVAIDKENKEMYSGDTPPKKGLDYYLLKFSKDPDILSGDNPYYGKIEYAYSLMAKECGINMSETGLWNHRHFYTKRFDRDCHGNKFHYQTFNSFFGKDFEMVREHSYEEFFGYLQALNLPQEDITQFFTRMCFNVIALNRDDHTKNHSLILENDRQWRLAPAYDICFSYEPGHEWVGEQSLSVNRKTDKIEIQDLLEVGSRFMVKRPKEIIQNTMEIVRNFKKYTENLDIPLHLVSKIEQNILNTPIYKGHSFVI